MVAQKKTGIFIPSSAYILKNKQI